MEINPEIDSPYYGSVLICAVRYALGRKTYVSQLIVYEILLRWSKLSPQDKVLICQDILHYFKSQESLGVNCDDDCWKKIIEKGVEDKILVDSTSKEALQNMLKEDTANKEQ
ncbi:hypothetical protein UFOVP410_163 [uncultured Caudovirales phage]|uniref:Uncharacterized protein n=1 Tax=uncultured Caudovirales phage TaxID=2100421 RepID=A0A6J5M3G9_9CAUD|nr:hypothetical protein UFOVP410_163 [uncultured Caudovirales phage]